MTRSVEDDGSGILVSVIMPVFTTPEDWLDAAVASVRRQQCGFRIELVVCDDGSDDGTRKRLADLEADSHEHPSRLPITVIRHGENTGPSAARNTAARYARGRYLVWLDSDDELPDGALATLVQRARQTGASMVLSRCEVWDEDGRAVRDPAPYLELARHLHATPEDPLAQVVFSVQAQLVEAVAFHRVGCFDEEYRWAEVTEFFLRFVQHEGIDSVQLLPSVAYTYHRRTGSRSTCRESHLEFRRRALHAYYDQCVGTPVVDGIEYLDRAPETGAQHFRLLTGDGVIEPRYLAGFMQPDAPQQPVDRDVARRRGTALLPATVLAAWLLWSHSSLRTLLVLVSLAMSCTVVSGIHRKRWARFFQHGLGDHLLRQRKVVGAAVCGLLTMAALRSPQAYTQTLGVQIFAAMVAVAIIGYLSVAPPAMLRAHRDRARLLLLGGTIGSVAGCGYVALTWPPMLLIHDLTTAQRWSIMVIGGTASWAAIWWLAHRARCGHLTIALSGWSVAVGVLAGAVLLGLARLVPDRITQVTASLPSTHDGLVGLMAGATTGAARPETVVGVLVIALLMLLAAGGGLAEGNRRCSASSQAGVHAGTRSRSMTDSADLS